MDLKLGKPAVQSMTFWGSLIFGVGTLACGLHLISGTIAGVDACDALRTLSTGTGAPLMTLGIARKLAALVEATQAGNAPPAPAAAPKP